ncbi:HNH endonuclease signature motif containing protein [Actinomadura bangladeshensis]|uniref:DUF222 domain-containing protein n=1 Tax=Actinomadura bangladeshensis TaxID=453573 RepID=A0A6L9Q897_9ACTN|nr:HNH endonuclease signature motif containing protein [Actinomadura bangladeshensis]NEA21637.1 DUF222 domain-containing protein [Actinomadura bangladeshensis]
MSVSTQPAERVVDVSRRQREWEDRDWFPPGPQLAICLSGRKERLADLTDDELLQFAAAARRQTSWAQARELAAIAELSRRRTDAETAGDPDYRILSAHDSVTEEVAAALTITGNAAATLVHLSERLTGPLADTAAALEAGRIDMARARVICDVTDDMPDQVTRQLQTAALEKASGQTTGQLRRRIKRIAQRLAPAAAEERKREAVRARRLELWDTPAGTADLALCDLPPEDAHAIYNKITAAAHGLKKDGDPRPLPQLRADLTTLLLKGAQLPTAVQILLAEPPQLCDAPANDTPHPDDTDATPLLDSLSPPPQGPSPQGIDDPRQGSSLQSVHLHGVQSHRGVKGGQGANGLHAPHPRGIVIPDVREAYGIQSVVAAPTGADAAGTGRGAITRALARMVEHRLTHVRDHVAPRALPTAIVRAVQSIHDGLAPARDAVCQGGDETHGRPGYRPPDALRRDILARHATCVFPTCNRDARRCDLDHTVPWRPGTTCHCNLAPLCRRHHRLKQTPGWTLHQIWPGLMVWTAPSGGWYVVHPDRE